MLIIRPFGMTLETAHRIIKAWDDETGQDNFIDEWCGEELDIIYQREKLVSKLRVYRTPGDIASFQRGWHDAIARQRPLAYLDYHGCLVNTVSKVWTLRLQDPYPRGWNPAAYIQGWEYASNRGEYPLVATRESFDFFHYRITALDGGTNCLYVKEMSFAPRRTGVHFEYSKLPEYLADMVPNCINHLSIDYLRGRTLADGVLEIAYPSAYHQDHEVGGIRATQ